MNDPSEAVDPVSILLITTKTWNFPLRFTKWDRMVFVETSMTVV